MRFVWCTAAALVVATPALAQEFDELAFDETSLVFDDTTLADDILVFDETSLATDGQAPFEQTAAELPKRGPDLELTYSQALTDSMGAFSRSSALSLTAKNSASAEGLGFVEWQLSLNVDDPGGASVASVELDRLIVQNSAGDFSWRIGKYPIGWGEIEAIPVLDVINSGLSLADLGTAREELPGQWFASLDHFGDRGTVSAFVGLDPQVAHGAAATSQGADYEAGAKIALPIEQGQVSFYAARLLPQAGVVDFAGATSSAQPYTLLGASAHKALDAILLEADFAAKLGLERATATSYAKDDRLDFSLGAEWAVSGTTQLTGSVAVQRWRDAGGGYFDFGPGGAVAANRTAASYLLSATRSIAGSDIDLSAFLGGAADGSTRFLAFQANWTPSDTVNLAASFSVLSASAGSVLAPMDGTASLSLETGIRF